MLSQARAKREELILRRTRTGWKAFSCLTPNHRARFVRIGVAKHRLRYQLTTTSLAQAAGMLTCVLQAGAAPRRRPVLTRCLPFASAVAFAEQS